MTQTERIKWYMRKYGSITQSEATEYLGCSRLAARIADIRAEGEQVNKEIVTGKNRFGERVHFARYSLEVRS